MPMTPEVAYVCAGCWKNASESSCYSDSDDLRIAPDGRQLCEVCYDEDYTWDDAGKEKPFWRDLPKVIPLSDRLLSAQALIDTCEAALDEIADLYPDRPFDIWGFLQHKAEIAARALAAIEAHKKKEG